LELKDRIYILVVIKNYNNLIHNFKHYMNNQNQEDKLRIRSVQELFYQMEGLLVLRKVLSSTLKKWFLSGGTLLGAYRDGDFIPWDWDVEVTVLTEEAINKKNLIINKLLESGFKLKKIDPSKENFKIVAEGWGTKYEILGRHLDKYGNSRVRLMTKVPSKFFEKIQIIKLRGHNFPAPSPTEGFLEALYGNWKIPVKTTDKKSYFSANAYIQRKQNIYEKFLKWISSLI